MRIVDAFKQPVIFIVLFFANGVLFHFLQPSVIATPADARCAAKGVHQILQLEFPYHCVDRFEFFRWDQLRFFACLSSSSSFFSNSFSASRYLMRASAFSSFFSAERSFEGGRPVLPLPRRSSKNPSSPYS